MTATIHGRIRPSMGLLRVVLDVVVNRLASSHIRCPYHALPGELHICQWWETLSSRGCVTGMWAQVGR